MPLTCPPPTPPGSALGAMRIGFTARACLVLLIVDGGVPAANRLSPEEFPWKERPNRAD